VKHDLVTFTVDKYYVYLNDITGALYYVKLIL